MRLNGKAPIIIIYYYNMENKNITNKKTFKKNDKQKSVKISSIQPRERGLPHGSKPPQFNLL